MQQRGGCGASSHPRGRSPQCWLAENWSARAQMYRKNTTPSPYSPLCHLLNPAPSSPERPMASCTQTSRGTHHTKEHSVRASMECRWSGKDRHSLRGASSHATETADAKSAHLCGCCAALRQRVRVCSRLRQLLCNLALIPVAQVHEGAPGSRPPRPHREFEDLLPHSGGREGSSSACGRCVSNK